MTSLKDLWIEKIARAICKGAGENPDDTTASIHPHTQLDDSQPWWQGYIGAAEQVLKVMGGPADMSHSYGRKW